jgi:hypothetical protein
MGDVLISSRSLSERGWRLVLAVAAMMSGSALVVTVFTRISLGLTLTLAAVCMGAIGWRTWIGLSPASRPWLWERIRTGALAGIPATVAYDVVRFSVVKSTGFQLWPFDTFVLFGQAILGTGRSPWLTVAVGTAYHYVNGLCFAVAYSIVFRRRLFLYGVLWGLGLEASMLLVYPNWLPLGRVMGEFTIVSVSGHIAYGMTLGLLVQRLPVHVADRLQRRRVV